MTAEPTAARNGGSARTPALAVDLLDMLDLARVDDDLFRSDVVFHDRNALYGGQVMAQALCAAGRTVDGGRRPHSLHAYFLRAGDSSVPTEFAVTRDRDGRSFSARRVTALQGGRAILTLSASFRASAPDGSDGWDGSGGGPAVEQEEPMPAAGRPPHPPEEFGDPSFRLHSIEARVPPQPHADRTTWPTRFWARCWTPLPDDPLVHACAMTYLSDLSTGVLPAPDGSARSGASIDHALWLHRPADLREWVLCEYHPRYSGQGRGWYTGSVFRADGALVASLAQETLFR